MKADAVTVEVVRNKLDGIANEMQSSLLRCSFSPIVKEGLDASASLFTMKGETLAQAIAIPIHLGTLIPVVAKILEVFPANTMAENDVFILNDPYLGGTHLPDIALVMPVFHKGRPIALSAAMTHHQDVGGMSPGSVPTNATEIFQEGIRIPLLKLYDGGVANNTLIEVLRLNVRLPDTLMGDLNAQIAACKIGDRRLRELADRHGGDNLILIFNDLLNRSEKMIRQAISAMPDGVFRYFDFLDNDGVELDKKVRIETKVKINGDHVHVDFSNTNDQVRGPFNCVPSGAWAAVYFAVQVVVDPDIPTNGGCLRPITLNLPLGSLVNPIPPAPVNSRTSTIKRIAGCVIGALRQAVPEQTSADAAGEMLSLTFGGRRIDGSPYIIGELIASGSGACNDKDGVDVIETDGTNCMNLPVEALEMDAPIRVYRSELRTGSGGDGAYRGGLGLIREYEVLHGNVAFTYRGERHCNVAAGYQGGEAGARAYAKIWRQNGCQEQINSKLMTILGPGDRVEIATAGGGGYGPPSKRHQSDVDADWANEKIFDRRLITKKDR